MEFAEFLAYISHNAIDRFSKIKSHAKTRSNLAIYESEELFFFYKRMSIKIYWEWWIELSVIVLYIIEMFSNPTNISKHITLQNFK